MALTLFLLLIGGYLLGSIPTAVWVSKSFYGFDVRQHGSGNAGATNTFRILGKKAGISVLIVDILKGLFAVQLVRLSAFLPGSSEWIRLELALGICAFFGHVFPVFAGFKGGKGIATLVGVIFSLHPLGAAVTVLVFVLVYGSTQIVSLGSMISGLCFPVILVFLFGVKEPALIGFSVAIALLVIFTHRKNIGRLLKGCEPKTPLKGTPKTVDK